jgi:hypothetical protein
VIEARHVAGFVLWHIRIAISGSHQVGNTTLAEALNGADDS